MRKINFFLILLLTSILSLVVLLAVGFLLTPTPAVPSQSGWFNNMWDCMGDWMSGRYQTADPYWSLFGVGLIVLVGLVIVGVGGVVYFQFYPEIRVTDRSISQSLHTAENSSSVDSVLKTLKDDERKVMDVLLSHDGKYLQKYIRREAGLSRLKTHRVLARLVERGIVTLEKSGNTNEVHIAEWLKKK